MPFPQSPRDAISEVLVFLRTRLDAFVSIPGARLTPPPPQSCEDRYGGPLITETPVVRSMQDEMPTLTT